jgi:hypothetical protein
LRAHLFFRWAQNPRAVFAMKQCAAKFIAARKAFVHQARAAMRKIARGSLRIFSRRTRLAKFFRATFARR